MCPLDAGWHAAGCIVRSPAQIPIVICIDVEPDGFFIDRDRPLPWHGYERSIEFFRGLRARAEAATGRPVHFNWFFRMDPQIAETYGAAAWGIHFYARATAELQACGDEIALHVHPYRWRAEQHRWIVDQGSQSWVDHCVEDSFQAFEGALGRRCTAFRFGQHWMSNATARMLDRLGVRYELTLEPGLREEPVHHRGERSTGVLPDYSGVPTVPYRPSLDDYRNADRSRHDGMWMIPISTAPVRPRWYRLWYYSLFLKTGISPAWTAMASHDPVLFDRVVNEVLQRESDAYLALTLRTNALSNARLARRVTANFTALLDHPLAGRFAFATPEEALRILRPTC